MERIPVRSSNLKSVGYDPEERILEVQFHDGSIYRYFSVPDYKFERLLNASSKGRYFDAYIKKAGYRYRKVR